MAAKYTITLGDGTQLDNLERNGDCFIKKGEAIDPGIFHNNLFDVVIECDGDEDEEAQLITGTYSYMKLIRLWNYGSDCWFALRELTSYELKEITVDARLSYLEMITGGITEND